MDYIRFIYAEDGRKTAKLCGHLNSNPSDLKKIFIDDEKGRIKVSIHFDRFLPMKRDEDTLDIELLFTAYGGKKKNLFFAFYLILSPIYRLQ